jgi:sugar lactone lactonase YvrE
LILSRFRIILQVIAAAQIEGNLLEWISISNRKTTIAGMARSDWDFRKIIAIKNRRIYLMRYGYFLAGLLIIQMASVLPAQDQTHGARLTLLWKSEPVFKVPESVTFDPKTKILYISNIDGKPADKDGQGFISKVKLDGAVIKLDWAIGLNAPKGSAIIGDCIFVSDIDQLVEIALTTGKILRIYPAAGARFLNDVAADEAGHIYVSDMSEGNSCIYRLNNGKLEKWFVGSEISSPNGLSYAQGFLFVGNSGDGKIKKIHIAAKQVSDVAAVGSGIDGLSADGRGGWIVSDWDGKTSLVSVDGNLETLLDTSTSKVNAADLAYAPEQRLLVIPTFFDNRIVAYTLNHK